MNKKPTLVRCYVDGQQLLAGNLRLMELCFWVNYKAMMTNILHSRLTPSMVPEVRVGLYAGQLVAKEYNQQIAAAMQIYLSVLDLIDGQEVFLGRRKSKIKQRLNDEGEMASYKVYEQKQFKMKLACDLVADARLSNIGVHVLISDDIDFVPAVLLARKKAKALGHRKLFLLVTPEVEPLPRPERAEGMKRMPERKRINELKALFLPNNWITHLDADSLVRNQFGAMVGAFPRPEIWMNVWKAAASHQTLMARRLAEAGVQLLSGEDEVE